jgi:DNA-binding GntR family transcriptional regulator
MSRAPLYQEIADDLRRRLAAGEWPVGGPMTGITALQAEYGNVALNTIRRAQDVLQQDGLLEPRQGSGTFVLALPDRGDPAHVELRQAVTELRHALSAALDTVNRMARRLDDGQPNSAEA